MKLSAAIEPLLCEPARTHGFLISHSSTFLPTVRAVPRPAPFGKVSRTAVRLSASNFLFGRKIGYVLNVASARYLDFIRNHLDILKFSSFSGGPLGCGLPLSILGCFAFVFPSVAADTELEVSNKINLEAVVVAIDNFFNRYPFFVSGIAFIWLVVIPLTEEYMKKYKRISALDAFEKLKEVPSAQLLDIRTKQSLNYLPSPNLKILKKNTAQVDFTEGSEEHFVKAVLKVYQDPENTVICVLDNFGVDSLKAAELLVNNGFKEAYAIMDGLRGKDGWQSIQETLLPASLHVYPRIKKSKLATPVESGEEKMSGSNYHNGTPGHVMQKETKSESNQATMDPTTNVSEVRSSDRPLSPYPNYKDLKPPSSPSPAKPQQ